MGDHLHHGTTGSGQPYLIHQSGTTVTVRIGLDGAPEEHPHHTEAEALTFYYRLVKEASKP